MEDPLDLFRNFFAEANSSISRNLNSVEEICAGELLKQQDKKNQAMYKKLQGMNKLLVAAFEDGNMYKAIEQYYFQYIGEETGLISSGPYAQALHSFSQLFLVLFIKAFLPESLKNSSFYSDETDGDAGRVEITGSQSYTSTMISQRSSSDLGEEEEQHSSIDDINQLTDRIVEQKDELPPWMLSLSPLAPNLFATSTPYIKNIAGGVGERFRVTRAATPMGAPEEEYTPISIKVADVEPVQPMLSVKDERAVAADNEETHDMEEIIIEKQPETTETPKMSKRRSTRPRRRPSAHSLFVETSDGETPAEMEQPSKKEEAKEKKKRGPKRKMTIAQVLAGLADESMSGEAKKKKKTRGGGGGRGGDANSTEQFPCTNCSKSFTTPARLHQHVQRMHDENSSMYKIIHGEKGKTVVCPDCGLELESKNKLYNHRGKVHKKDSGTYKYFHGTPGVRSQCKECDRDYASPNGLAQHIVRFHKPESVSYKKFHGIIGGPFKCKTCPEVFTDIYKLYEHNKTHKPHYQALFKAKNARKAKRGRKAAKATMTADKAAEKKKKMAIEKKRNAQEKAETTDKAAEEKTIEEDESLEKIVTTA